MTLFSFTDAILLEHNTAILNMGGGIAIFCLVLILAPVIMCTIKRMTNEIQVYAAEALEKQKVNK